MLDSYYLIAATTDSVALMARVLIILFSVVLPLLLMAISVLYLQRVRRQRQELEPRIDAIIKSLDELPALDMAQLAAVDEIFNSYGENEIKGAYEELKRESQKKYGGRWFPPLSQILCLERIAPAEMINALSLTPAISVFSCGLIASALLYVYIKSLTLPFSAGLAFLPLAAGTAVGLFLFSHAVNLGRELNRLIGDFQLALGRCLPVYETQSGVALLIDEMLRHDHAVRESVDQFHETARRLADSEFSKGICDSVRQIMLNEVAPPIRESSRTLSDLARNLDRRQMNGMENLAGQFSGAVARSLAEQLNPLQKQLEYFNQMMGETREFIDDSVAVLETSREQNIVLNRDITESLKLMTVAKNDLANEMAEISENMKIVSRATEKMTALHAGEEASLSERIHDLSQAFERSLSVLERGLQGSGDALELAANLKLEQESQNQELTGKLTQIIHELSAVGETMRSSSKNFTQESSAYVNQTLKNFDQGLAEVVERLIFTASAIRDAVDALPVALRPGKDLN